MVVERWRERYYELGLPGVKCDLRVTINLIERYLPSIYRSMKRIRADSCSVWLTSMLVTLFQNNLNEDAARRFLDMMFVLGSQKNMIFGMILAFVSENAPIFSRAKNSEELDIALLDRVRSLRNRLNVNDIFLTSLEYTHKIESEEISKLRQLAMIDLYGDDDDDDDYDVAVRCRGSSSTATTEE